MSMHYATDAAASDLYTLPNILVTQFTAHEIAETLEDGIYEFSKRQEFRLASMNGTVRDRMLDAMVDELNLEAGFMWCLCFPGCLPDTEWSGPFPTHAEALADAREQLADE